MIIERIYRPEPRVVASMERHRAIRRDVSAFLGFAFAIACVLAIGFGWLS